MFRRIVCFFIATILTSGSLLATSRVAVIEDAPWSPNDSSRDGAAELEVMLCVARLQHDHQAVGVVGIGDRRGIFQEGMRRGLELAVQHGVPVVRLARGPQACLRGVDDLFIDGGMLSPAAASALLSECLARHGALPSVRTTGQPNAEKLSALRKKLQLYQADFNAHQPALVASR
jgi:hypothetical protein